MKEVKLTLPDAPTMLPVQAAASKIYLYENHKILGKVHRCPTGVWSVVSLEDSETVLFAADSLEVCLNLGLRRGGTITELDNLGDLYQFLAKRLN